MIQRRGFLAGLAGMLGLANAPIGASEAKADAVPAKLTGPPQVLRCTKTIPVDERLWRADGTMKLPIDPYSEHIIPGDWVAVNSDHMVRRFTGTGPYWGIAIEVAVCWPACESYVIIERARP